MRIVALINDARLAPDGTETFEALAPSAQGALDWSLSLAKAEDEVIALTAGPATSDTILREALDRGADRAIRVWVSSEDETTLDANVRGISELLAATIRDLNSVDLIVCGGRSTDWGTGITGPATAFSLDISHLTQISAIAQAKAPISDSQTPPRDGSSSPEGDQAPRKERLLVTQDRDNGALHCELQLPALLAIATGPTAPALRPRRPDAKLEFVHADEIGFEADDPLPWPSMPIEPAAEDQRHDKEPAPETETQVPNSSGRPR